MNVCFISESIFLRIGIQEMSEVSLKKKKDKSFNKSIAKMWRIYI